MSKYILLPTKSRQTIIIATALVGYIALLATGSFLFPHLPDQTKKTLTQIGLVVLYIATLNAGLAFVWTSKARRNIDLANATIKDCNSRLQLLNTQTQLLGQSFAPQIAAANDEVKEANSQLVLATSLPSVYDWAGSISMILVACGTMFCFVGAG